MQDNFEIFFEELNKVIDNQGRVIYCIENPSFSHSELIKPLDISTYSLDKPVWVITLYNGEIEINWEVLQTLVFSKIEENGSRSYKLMLNDTTSVYFIF